MRFCSNPSSLYLLPSPAPFKEVGPVTFSAAQGGLGRKWVMGVCVCFSLVTIVLPIIHFPLLCFLATPTSWRRQITATSVFPLG